MYDTTSTDPRTFRDETRYHETTFNDFFRKREILLEFIEIHFDKRAIESVFVEFSVYKFIKNKNSK